MRRHLGIADLVVSSTRRFCLLARGPGRPQDLFARRFNHRTGCGCPATRRHRWLLGLLIAARRASPGRGWRPSTLSKSGWRGRAARTCRACCRRQVPCRAFGTPDTRLLLYCRRRCRRRWGGQRRCRRIAERHARLRLGSASWRRDPANNRSGGGLGHCSRPGSAPRRCRTRGAGDSSTEHSGSIVPSIRARNCRHHHSGGRRALRRPSRGRALSLRPPRWRQSPVQRQRRHCRMTAWNGASDAVERCCRLALARAKAWAAATGISARSTAAALAAARPAAAVAVLR